MLLLGIYCTCRALLLRLLRARAHLSSLNEARVAVLMKTSVYLLQHEEVIFFVAIIHQNSANGFEEPVGQEQWGRGGSCCSWVTEVKGTMWLSQFWTLSFLSWLHLLRWNLASVVTWFTHEGQYFCPEVFCQWAVIGTARQGMEWKTCSHDPDKCWNDLASRKQTGQKSFSRLKSDLILLFKPAACCIWLIEWGFASCLVCKTHSGKAITHQSPRGVRL